MRSLAAFVMDVLIRPFGVVLDQAREGTEGGEDE